MLPPLIIGVGQATAFLLVAVFFFQVPFRGSLLLLYVAIVFFLASVVGVGLFISSLAQTQQQAFLGTFLFASPAISAVRLRHAGREHAATGCRSITLANPLRHFLVIVRGLFLKGMPAADVAANILPLILIAAFTLSVAAWLFRRRME